MVSDLACNQRIRGIRLAEFPLAIGPRRPEAISVFFPLTQFTRGGIFTGHADGARPFFNLDVDERNVFRWCPRFLPKIRQFCFNRFLESNLPFLIDVPEIVREVFRLGPAGEIGPRSSSQQLDSLFQLPSQLSFYSGVQLNDWLGVQTLRRTLLAATTKRQGEADDIHDDPFLHGFLSGSQNMSLKVVFHQFGCLTPQRQLSHSRTVIFMKSFHFSVIPGGGSERGRSNDPAAFHA